MSNSLEMFALSQLPERFKGGSHSEMFTAYIGRKYSNHGFKKDHSIYYNPGFTPEYSSKFERENRVNRYRWVENLSNGLRKAGDAHAIAKLDHTGWFTDSFQDETVHGEVYRLPSRKGKALFVPAVNDPNNDDCACLDFSRITEDETQAARWADEMAQRWAEFEREYREKEAAENRLSEIADEIKEAYQTFRRIAMEIKASKVQDVAIVRELVRDKWRETKREIKRLRRERKKIEAEGYDAA
jgi:hypothetical protein